MESALEDLRKEMAGDDIERTEPKVDAANKAASRRGQHMAGGSGGSQGVGDQTPEAEYGEVKKCERRWLNRLVLYIVHCSCVS
ncbi:hypothetical protein MUK42_06707 [Musa troglodytarum]|uniref:Uncharacterized protein n=1 Tax=Musa troglodytarum TaxID=320322 RepID=A0A9E7ELW3_9LILI|nr:hypothetical protein MUK42_06707 [Musa troglodytarum]